MSFRNKTKSQNTGLSARPPVLLPEPCTVNAAAAWDEGYWLLPGEVWTVCEEGKKTAEQPIQRCMAERPEVSRGHSTVKGDVPEKWEYERSGKG